MANEFYAPGERRAKQVRRLFATIAPRYDLINDLQSLGLHRYWKRRLVRLTGSRPGLRALDLCCGTGDVALALARHGAQVVGLDFCPAMLEVARRRTVTGCAVRPDFLCADVLQIPFPDGTFDAVTISYGLRNLASFEAGLREMRRVTKPGGRVLVLDFGKPRNAVWRALYFAYLRWCVPPLGKIFCGHADAYAYILESLNNYPAQEGVAKLMRQNRFTDIRIVNLLGGIMSINSGKKEPDG
ncbi:MAG: bifunctional demethylmenaquinone methyltransferase/2-methoxy-6-polyprenyl-1,4-benzoquinol methylase UbiE [Limisphaerales bacterium]